MNTQSLRPKAELLSLKLYDRPIHPELIQQVAMRQLRRREYTLTIRLTPTGHIVSWETEDLHLCEVASTDAEPLPVGGKLLERRLDCDHQETVIPKGGYCYQVSTQVETLTPELFPHVQEELLGELNKGALAHFFSPAHRLAFPPVSVAVHDAGPGFVSVCAFHTFPDETCVLKTQTLIEYDL